MKKNLIIAASINYSKEQINPFIQSLNKVFDGTLVLFTNKKFNYKKLNYSIIQINPYVAYSNSIYGNIKTRSANNIRFIWYKEFLKNNKSFSNILLIDIRDVYFQKNPFEFVQNKILVAQEDNCISNCPYNSDWIRSLYGEDVLKEMQNNPIYCSGTILGSREIIDELIEYEIMHMSQYKGDDKIIDQGIFNYFVFEKSENCTINNNKTGSIYTMGYSNTFNFNKFGELINNNNEPYAIIHQYDRYKWLANYFTEKYKFDNFKKWLIF